LIILIPLALLFLLCLLNIKITVGNKESFYYRFSIGGIRINPEWFTKKKEDDPDTLERKKQHKKQKAVAKAEKKAAKVKDGKTVKKKKKSLGQTLSLITDIAKTASHALPRGIRIKLKYLNITVGGREAQDVAVTYGKLYALLSALFALFDGYKGFLYGFYAKRNKVVLNTDYLSGKTKAEFELTVSFFLWQILFAAVRVGIAYITHIIRAAGEDEAEEDADEEGTVHPNKGGTGSTAENA